MQAASFEERTGWALFGDTMAGPCFVTPWQGHVLLQYGRALYCESMTGPCTVTVWQDPVLWLVTLFCGCVTVQSILPSVFFTLDRGAVSWGRKSGKVKTDQGEGGGSSLGLEI